MSWPSLQDYNEAIQNPRFCFADPELQRGSPTCNTLGIPKVSCGNFASVYQMFANGRTYAVRCFTTYRVDQEQRYAIIGQYLERLTLRVMVRFSFLLQGIRVQGKWYPIVKMEWIDGEPLDTYIEKHLGQPAVLRSLADGFLNLVTELCQASIAHADLQHGNILVVNGELRLIDYDGMYVPGLDGRTSHELGHRNYQHPRRNASQFGPYLDHFAAWVIYLSLVALSIEPNLWTQVRAGDEQLLFRQDDFEHPTRSQSFQTLKRMRDPQLQFLVSLFESFLALDVLSIPPLDRRHLSPPPPAPAISASPPGGSQQSGGFVASVPSVTAAVPTTFVGPSWIADHLEPLPLVRFSSRLLFERLVVAYFGLAVGAVAYAAAGGILGVDAASFGVAGLLALASLFLRRRFRHRPEISQKARLAKALADVGADIIQLQSALDGLITQLKQRKLAESALLDEMWTKQQDLAQREQREIAEVDDALNRAVAQLHTQRRTLDPGEVGEISNIRKELQRIRDDLQTRRQTLNQHEAKEVADALAQLQHHHLSAQLGNFRLDGANIPGIGASLKKRLFAQGIRIAADIANVQIARVFRGGHPHEIAYIEVAGRGSVHIEGVGPKKATALLDWRQGIVSQFRHSIPQSLPPATEGAIRDRYRNERHTLDAQEANAGMYAEQMEATVRTKYKRSREAIDAQEARAKVDAQQQKDRLRTTYRFEQEALRIGTKAVQSTLAQECSAIIHRVGETQRALAEKQWEIITRKREVDAYRQVSFRAYLRQIIFSPKTPSP